MTTIDDTALGCFAQGVEGDMTQCVVDGVFGAGPAPELIGLLLAGTLIASLYIAGDGSVVVPGIVTIMLFGLVVTMLPAQFALYAYTIAFFGAAVAVFAAYTRFTHQGRF